MRLKDGKTHRRYYLRKDCQPLTDQQRMVFLPGLAPDALQSHLEFPLSRLTTYDALRPGMISYAENRRAFSEGSGAVPTELDSVKGKPKGGRAQGNKAEGRRGRGRATSVVSLVILRISAGTRIRVTPKGGNPNITRSPRRRKAGARVRREGHTSLRAKALVSAKTSRTSLSRRKPT